MALSIDGTQTGKAAAASTVAAAALTTAGTGRIIVVCVSAEWVNSIGASGTVSGVTGTGLTFAKRSGRQDLIAGFAGDGSGTNRAYQDLEIWWAYASATLSGVVITATFTKPGNNNFDAAGIIVFGVTGFTGTIYQTAPWDQNGSLPAGASNAVTSIPGVAGVSTTNAATMLIGAASQTRGIWGSTNIGSGYTLIAIVTADTGAVNYSNVTTEQKVVSSIQSSVTVGLGSNITGWIMLADALSESGGAVPSIVAYTLKPYLRR